MITAQLMGRLGNTLFQMAAAVAYAKQCAQPYIFPPWPYEGRIGPQGCFSDAAKKIRPHYKEPSFTYMPIPPTGGDLQLVGYFQSARYFEDYGIRELFLPLAWDPKIRHSGPVVHIRRGDYVGSPHYVQLGETDYYRRALAEFAEPHAVTVVTDDPAWCIDNCERVLGTDDFAVTSAEDPVMDLMFIATFDRIIISNSSFSWWAAWFSGGGIIAPKAWFGPASAHLDTQDLIPRAWRRV